MNQKAKLSYLAVIALALAFGFASLAAIAKNDNAKSEKSNKSSQSEKSKNKSANLKNFEKPDKTKGQTNAQIHKEKIKEVVENLEQVAAQEETAGNGEVSNQVEQVADSQDQTQEETTEAIEEVESRGKIKTFLIGTDYKNLGQLRSNLVHNRNQIRQLTRTMNQLQNNGDSTLLQQQLEVLMQERERIKEVITNNEDSFSLFGWVSRFLANYEQTPISKQEESDLTEEVESAIELASAATTEAAETADSSVPIAPETTTTTDTGAAETITAQ